MTETATHDALLQAAIDEPGDPVHRLALADWHEERGDTLKAECWRWFAEGGRHPVHDPELKSQRHQNGEMPHWWGTNEWDNAKFPTANQLPRAWCFEIVDDEGDGNDCVKCFRTRPSAYAAALEAWCRLSDAQRSEAWGLIRKT